MKKLNQLDSWRAILSFIVFISHGFQILSTSEIKNQNWMRIWGPLAHISVLLFFFISGYVIWNSLQSRHNSDSKGKKFTLDFIKARFFRIFPPLIGSVIILYIFKLIIKIKFPEHAFEEFNFSKIDVIQYLAMYKVSLGKINAPLWSLIIEWWFYFIGLLIFKFSLQNNYFIKLIMLIICYFIIQDILISLNSDVFIYFLIWSIGAIVKKYELFEFKKTTKIISFLLIYYLFFHQNILLSGEDLSKNPMLQLFITIAFIGIIGIEFNVSILKFISKFSYTLYIIHYPIFIFTYYYFDLEHKNSIFTLATILVTTMFLSFILSKLLERNWSKTFTYLLNKCTFFRN